MTNLYLYSIHNPQFIFVEVYRLSYRLLWAYLQAEERGRFS